MKSNLPLKIFAIILLIPLIALIFGGCAAKSSEESSQTDSSGTTASAPEVSSTPTSETPSAPEESAPTGEPTFLIGLDGKAILTSEITRLENTDKTSETLTEDDLNADIFCDGFTYVKEPTGVCYNSYKNPELFEDYAFIGEAPVNKNEWKRVNVGDEICGLKVKAAQTHFMTNDWGYKFPARYYNTQYNFCELEGTAVLVGFLQVTAEAKLYPGTGGQLEFNPCESKLPVMPSYSLNDVKVGFDVDICDRCVFNHTDISIFGEPDCFNLGKFDETDCDLDGLGKGDVAYARVTLDNIKLFCGGGGTATVQKVELLSDILAHDDDPD